MKNVVNDVAADDLTCSMENGAQNMRTRISATARFTRRMLTRVLRSGLVATDRQTNRLPGNSSISYLIIDQHFVTYYRASQRNTPMFLKLVEIWEHLFWDTQ